MSEMYMDSPMRYEVQKGDNTPCKLVSIVTTKTDVHAGHYLWQPAGTQIENFVCGGTYNYCMSVKSKLEGE